MARYLVFSGIKYYAVGGANDLVDSFDKEEEAVLRAKEVDPNADQWSHVYDTKENRFVYKSQVKPHGDCDWDD